MGSSSLQQIKRRMRSVESTKKITSAMKLIATAKLKTWRGQMTKNRQYVDMLHSICMDVFSRTSKVNSPYLSPNNETNKTLFIVVTSTLGLCASYNYNMYKFMEENITANDDIYIIGYKGLTKLQNDKKEFIDKYYDVLSHITFANIHEITVDILKAYEDKKYKTIELLYTEYKNSLTFMPKRLKLLPAVDTSINNDDRVPTNDFDILMEPSPDAVAEKLIPMTIDATLFGKLIESQVAEQASRRTAMETATDNASDIIDSLNLEYNKARQSSITQEITEIISGANNR